jgi:hypothetical protein
VVYCIKAEEFVHKFSKDDRSWKVILQLIEKKEKEAIEKIVKTARKLHQGERFD